MKREKESKRRREGEGEGVQATCQQGLGERESFHQVFTTGYLFSEAKMYIFKQPIVKNVGTLKRRKTRKN